MQCSGSESGSPSTVQCLPVIRHLPSPQICHPSAREGPSTAKANERGMPSSERVSSLTHTGANLSSKLAKVEHRKRGERRVAAPSGCDAIVAASPDFRARGDGSDFVFGMSPFEDSRCACSTETVDFVKVGTNPVVHARRESKVLALILQKSDKTSSIRALSSCNRDQIPRYTAS